MDCIAKALSINKNDIEHDKHLVFYNCNDHQLGFENIKTRANIPFARRHSLTVNCQKLFDGDELELQRATAVKDDTSASDIRMTSSLQECEMYVTQNGYITDSLSKDEEDFPIAFGIAMYKDEQQFEKLLRAIYRPQNHYCVHVDLKAEPKVLRICEKYNEMFF